MKKTFLVLGILMSTSLVYAGGINEKTADVKAVSVSEPNTEAVSDTTITLQEVSIRSHFCNEQETPLSITTIRPQDIRLHATAPNYVEMMQGVPGVYATASTGNYGDATLNMRGFKQDNISILLNGIPIQGLTSGSMYWSNWMGLADATYAIQIQKGMGSSMLADCAMGGMVNIITRTGNGTPHGAFSLSTTHHGLTKGTLNYSTGTLPHGWNIDLMLAYTQGHGFVEVSDVKTFSYMLSVSKYLDAHNTLIFTALGSPEQHDQRNTELSADEVDRYGVEYSKNWGYLRGTPYSIARNHYFKPYFTLQHLLDGERFNMKNSVYLAIADGGGRSTVSSNSKNSIISHQTADGHINFDAVEAENRQQQDADGKNIGQHAMIDYLSGHTQAGAIASGSYRFNDITTLEAGLQYQYYDTWSKMKMLDMLGSDYLLYYNKKYFLGDYVGSRYGRTTHHFSGFVQGKWTLGRLNANAGATIFNGNYRRHNDETGEVSDWASGTGMSAKIGLLYHLTPKHSTSSTSLFLNLGYNSRLPYAATYLASSDLKITNDVVNEKNLMGEFGVRSSWQGGGMELSGYVASWRDKTLTVSLSKRANEAAEKYQITGLNALHMGLELTAHQQLASWLNAKVYAMTASWKWKSSGKALIYDSYSGETLNEYTIFCDGLHVGDAPQSQLGAQLDFKPYKGIYAHIGWQFNARMYADFEPSSRTSDDKADAYMLPSYHLFDATIGWEGTLYRTMRLNLFATAQNIFNAKYIERGIDGKTHDIIAFRGYWGAPRLVSFGMRLNF